jgi:prepilin-type N-terminal cleavage/methylation domain-containing protein
MRMILKNEHGITLIELVMTLIIVAIMATLAGLAINSYITDGYDRMAQADVATLSAAMRMYILDHGFPEATVNLYNVLLPYLLIDSTSELPKDPYSNPKTNYVIVRRIPDGETEYKIFVGSRGHNGEIDYDATGSDDYYKYVR